MLGSHATQPTLGGPLVEVDGPEVEVTEDHISSQAGETAEDLARERDLDAYPEGRLSAQQITCIGHLVSGKRAQEAAELVGVARETVSRWHALPEFVAVKATLRNEVWTAIRLGLEDAVGRGIAAMVDLLGHEDWRARVSAFRELRSGLEWAAVGPRPFGHDGEAHRVTIDDVDEARTDRDTQARYRRIAALEARLPFMGTRRQPQGGK